MPLKERKQRYNWWNAQDPKGVIHLFGAPLGDGTFGAVEGWRAQSTWSLCGTVYGGGITAESVTCPRCVPRGSASATPIR